VFPLTLALGEQADEKRLHDLLDGSDYAPEKLDDSEIAFAQKIVRKTVARST